MNTKRRTATLITTALVVSALVIVSFTAAALVWAAAQSRPDYQGYDLNRPWFDGLYWDWFRDMFNGPQIKPQEEGTVQAFPLNSVPRSGVEPEIPATAMVNGRLLRDLEPANPTTADAASVANGQVLYGVYCAVCHGADGNAGTVVNRLGMAAPSLPVLLPLLSEAHLYNKIRYGGGIMPAYGFQTTQRERWDIVNYLKSAAFGKGASQ